MTIAVEEETLGEDGGGQLRYAAERDWLFLTFDDDFLSIVDERFGDVDHTCIGLAFQFGHDVYNVVQRIDRALWRGRIATLPGR